MQGLLYWGGQLDRHLPWAQLGRLDGIPQPWLHRRTRQNWMLTFLPYAGSHRLDPRAHGDFTDCRANSFGKLHFFDCGSVCPPSRVDEIALPAVSWRRILKRRGLARRETDRCGSPGRLTDAWPLLSGSCSLRKPGALC